MTERLPVAIVTLLLVAASASAQLTPYTPLAPMRNGETALNLPTAQILPERVWEVRFAHRFTEPINRGDIHSFWGLDSSADIGLGLAWSPSSDLQVGVFRTDVHDTYELYGKYVVVRQAPVIPVSVSLRGGVDWRTERGQTDRVSPFAQAIVSRQWGRKVELFAVPTWVGEAGPFEHAFNVPFGAIWAWRRNISFVLEIVPENLDLPDEVDSSTAWAIGMKRAVGGHYFEILVSNSRATHVDQYTTSAFLGGLREDDLHLGFNITRRFGGR